MEQEHADLHLIDDFNQASQELQAAMARIEDLPQDTLALLRANTPDLALGVWNDDFCGYHNCYNYALNRRSGDFLQPGSLAERFKWISCQGSVAAYTKQIHDNARKDGLRRLGSDLSQAFISLRADERLVALFAGKTVRAYHWFSFRKEGKNTWLWAHKQGESVVERCDNDKGFHDPFASAKQRSYDCFAGYYAAPVRLEKITNLAF